MLARRLRGNVGGQQATHAAAQSYDAHGPVASYGYAAFAAAFLLSEAVPVGAVNGSTASALLNGVARLLERFRQ